jgi:hypothetical protein
MGGSPYNYTNRFYPRINPSSGGGGSDDCHCTTSTPGPCDAIITLPPVGSDLQFKGLDAGTGVTLTDTGTCIEIAATGSSSTGLVVSAVYACPVTVSVLDAVALSGADAADQALASAAGPRPAIGVVVSKPGPLQCVVAYLGELGGFAGLVPGSTYYLSDAGAGQLTATAPSASGSLIQTLGVARNATTLVVMIDRDVTLLA